jgi:hypothetical protein
LRRLILGGIAGCCAAMLIAPAALASGSPKAHAAAYHFTGKTSQNDPFELLLSRSFRTTTLHFQYEVSCTSGLQFPDEETFKVSNTAVAKRGHRVSRLKFADTGTGTFPVTDPSGQSLTAAVRLSVAGKIRLDTGRASGHIEGDIALTNGDRCTTGNTPISWSASVD